MTRPAHKLLLLDGLRGVAACVVVAFHLGVARFAHGYLAVDFFFMLSGFVVTLAYQARLDSGVSTWSFLCLRGARLYPLYLLGLLLGFAFTVVQHGTGNGHPPLLHALAVLALGLVAVPAPSILQSGDTQMFPLDIALWSLLFEVLANVGHAALMRRRGDRTLAVVVLAAAGVLAWQGWAHGGLDLGGRTTTFAGGLARVAFAYVAGMLLCRMWSRGMVRVRVPAAVLAAGLAGLLATPLWGAAYDVGVVLVVYPCLLLLSARAEVGPRWAWVCEALGAASYAVYVLHLPVLRFAGSALLRLRVNVASTGVTMGLLVLVLALAVVADRVYDAPARQWLRAKLYR